MNKHFRYVHIRITVAVVEKPNMGENKIIFFENSKQMEEKVLQNRIIFQMYVVFVIWAGVTKAMFVRPHCHVCDFECV